MKREMEKDRCQPPSTVSPSSHGNQFTSSFPPCRTARGVSAVGLQKAESLRPGRLGSGHRRELDRMTRYISGAWAVGRPLHLPRERAQASAGLSDISFSCQTGSHFPSVFLTIHMHALAYSFMQYLIHMCCMSTLSSHLGAWNTAQQQRSLSLWIFILWGRNRE